MSTRYALLVVVMVLVACSACFPAQSLFTGDETAPAGSVVLFDGKDLSEWVYSASGKPAAWKVQDGWMEVHGGDIQTKREFGDFQLHLEFWLPLMANATGQKRANSGVYLLSVYEVQVLDSYGLVSQPNDCGAMYTVSAPMVNACRPPEHWQTYDIFFRAARFDAQGKKTSNAVISVLQNGVLIHNCLELPRVTHKGLTEPKMGPIRLQDHHCAVRYRGIWIRPI